MASIGLMLGLARAGDADPSTLMNFNAGFIDHLVENIVEQLADATRTATRGRPCNNKHGYDRSGKENECIFGSCLAVVVVLAPEDVLNKTLNVEVAVKDHGASIVCISSM